MVIKIATIVGLVILAFSNAEHHGDGDGRFEKPGAPDKCVAGVYQKDAPSREVGEYEDCRSWENKESCCTRETVSSIGMEQSLGLFNYSWTLCGNLSPQCEEFIKNEQCFYQCEPMLWYFHIPSLPDYVRRVPVCSSYCDRWFEACKDDRTCVEDWLGGYDLDFSRPIVNSCPVNSNCITFREMYGNGAGICNKMWGEAFAYSEDETNCTLMAFNATTNPNLQLAFPSRSDDNDDDSGSTTVQHYMFLILVMLTVAVFSINNLL